MDKFRTKNKFKQADDIILLFLDKLWDKAKDEQESQDGFVLPA